MKSESEYSRDALIDRMGTYGISDTMKGYFRKCIEFHTYPAPGMLIGVFMVDYALDLLRMKPGDKLFVTCETEKCLPDPPQVILRTTIGNHRLRIVPIGKFAMSFTPLSKEDPAKGVRVYLDKMKMKQYPALNSWYENSPSFDPDTQKKPLADEILSAGRKILSYETITMKVSPKRKWKSVTCSICGDTVPDYLAKDGKCLGCGSDRYYEKAG